MYTPTNILPARIVRSLKGSKRSSKRSAANNKPPVTNELLSSVFEAEEGNSCFDDFEEITYDDVLPDLDHETSTLDTRSISPLTPRQAPEISAPFALSHSKSGNPRLHHPRSNSVSHTLPELSLSRSYSRSSLPLFPYSKQGHSRSRVHLPVASTETLLSEFPKPPTHVPATSSRHITLVDPPPVPGVYPPDDFLEYADSLTFQIFGNLTPRNRPLSSRTQTRNFPLRPPLAHLHHLLSLRPIHGVPLPSIAGSNPFDLHSGSHVVQRLPVIPNALIEVSPSMFPIAPLRARDSKLLHTP